MNMGVQGGPAAGPGMGRSGRRISALLVDDSDFDRERLCRMGHSSGLDIEIVAVPSIVAMQDALNRQDFDLVLVDYRLEEGDGIAAVDVIRAQDRNRDVATVMVTGDARSSLAVAAMQHGCSDFLDKGELTPQMFRDRMITVLDRVSAESETRLAGMMQPERLRAAFIEAFDPPTVRRILEPALRPLLIEGLTEALKTAGLNGALLDQGGVENFVETFLEPDSFDFLP